MSRIAWPIVLTSATTVVLGLTDTALLGHYSTEALGIAALVVPLWIFFTALVVPWGSATQVLVARWHGADERRSIEELARSGLMATVVIGAVFAGAGAVAAPAIIAVTAPAEDFDRAEATAMVWVLLSALPGTAATAHLRGLLAGMGDTRTAARVSVLVAVINLVVSAVLIFPAHLGPVGSAIGSTIAIVAGAVLLAGRARASLDSRERLLARVDRAVLRSWSAIAGPDVVFGVANYGAEVVLAAMATTMGTVGLAAHRVMGIAISLVWMFVFGTAAALSILVGQRIGAEDRDGRAAFVRAASVLMLVCACAISVLLACAGEVFFAIFTTDADVIDTAISVVWTLPSVAPIMVVAMVYAAQLRASGDTKGIMYVSLLSTAGVTLPVAWVLTAIWHLGLPGIYYGLATGWVVRAAGTYLRFRLTEVDADRTEQLLV